MNTKPEPKFIAINLDIEDEEDFTDALFYGPFDELQQAVDYGNRNMQFFTVREIWEPDND